jgi:hypothetical protein
MIYCLTASSPDHLLPSEGSTIISQIFEMQCVASRFVVCRRGVVEVCRTVGRGMLERTWTGHSQRCGHSRTPLGQYTYTEPLW